MKNRILSLLVLLNLAILPRSFSQNVSINSTGAVADTSAMLDVSSTKSGFLMPRMTTVQQDAIILPATGLAIFNTTLNTIQVNLGTPLSPLWSSLSGSVIDTSAISNFYIKVRSELSGGSGIAYDNGTGVISLAPMPALTIKGNNTGSASNPADLTGAQANTILPTFTSTLNGLAPSSGGGTTTFLRADGTWATLPAALGSWSLTGNAATSPLTNFLGTTDNKSLRFRTLNVQGMILDSLGNVGIGAAPAFTAGTPREKLLVDAGTSATSFNVISGKGNIDNYLQLNIQNRAATGAASSDVVASNDVATETANFIDMGINSSGNTSTGTLGGPGTAYLYSTGNDFAIGNATATKSLSFFTDGTTAAKERMRILSNGNIGIGTTAPAYKLDVNGTGNFTGALNVTATNPLTLTGVQPGTTTALDSFLTINTGTVKKIPVSTFATPANSWSTTGNTGTVSSTNFIGTIDKKSFKIETWNTQGFILDSLGNVGIGTAPAFTAGAPREKLLVDAGTSATSFNVISGKGNIDNYLQLNIQNRAATAAASSDVVASNDAATETANFIDMGINSSGNTSTGTLGGPGTGYLYSTGNDFAIGNATATKSLLFFTDGTTAAKERMRILSNGNIGIGTTTPAYKLDVTGTGNFTGALNVNAINPLTLIGVQPGTTTALDSFLTINTGIVKKLAVSTFATPANSWSTAGNTGTLSLTNFIGTIDKKSFKIKTWNTQGILLDSLGNVGVGFSPIFTTPVTRREKFLVDAGSSPTDSTSSFNVISGKGYIDNYLQLNIQNRAATPAASSDIVASNDAATEAINFIDMGVNSSGNTSTGVLGGPSTAYLYATGNDFAIGNASNNKSLLFFTDGITANKERMRIDDNGNVGIGTTAPVSALDVHGTNPLTLTGVQTGTTTALDSFLTINTGTVKKLAVSTFATPTGSWSTTGNTGTVSSTNFIGTIDKKSFKIKTWNTQGILLDSLGNVGVGFSPLFTTPLTRREKFLVDAGSSPTDSTSSFNVISGKGYIDNYLQLNIQNRAATAAASSDIVASNDAATEAINFIDMGVNSSGNTSTGVLGGASTAYLYATGNDFAIGNASNNKSLLFFTDGITANKERMRIDDNGNVGIGTAAPVSALDVHGTNPLTLTGVQTGTTTALDSFLTINTGIVKKLAVSNFATPSNSWSTTGNTGTVSSTNFIGTIDKKSFKIKTWNNQGILLDSLGNVGIGESPTFTAGVPREKFLVDAGNATIPNTSFNVISGKGYIDNYLQLNIQNRAGTAAASSDIVASNDVATETANFIDMGINSSGNTSTGSLGGAGTAYLYATGNDFAIGNATVSKSLTFFTGGTGSTERMRIDNTGKVGIANAAPTEKLDVTGNIRFSGSLMPNNLAGVAGTILTSNGAGVAPTWNAVAALVAPTAAQGDILYASAANTFATLPKNTTATRYLSNTGTNNNPAWSQINLANGVTGNLPVTNLGGGTAASATTYWTGNGTWSTPAVDTTSIGNFSLKVRSLFSSAAPVTFVNGVVGIAQATGVTDGYLSGADWTTFNNKGNGTVTDVETGYGLSGGAITSAGTIVVDTAALHLKFVGLADSTVYASVYQNSLKQDQLNGTGFVKQLGSTTSYQSQIALDTEVTGVLPVSGGGTNISTYATGDLTYASATNVLSKLPVGTDGQILTLAGGVPTWASTTQMAISTKTTDYTVTNTDYTIVCNNTVANMTVTLPTAVGISGRIYNIKKMSGASFSVSVAGNGTEAIDGSNIQILTTMYSKMTIQSDGANWIILSN